MIRALAVLVLALPAPSSAQEARAGGIATLACREVIGEGSAPYLAQVGDWTLGYLAGRLDAGQVPSEDTALSTDAGIDAVTDIAVRCRQDPGVAVIDAVRDYARGIFDEEPQGGPVSPLAMGDTDEDIVGAAPRPEPRPERTE